MKVNFVAEEKNGGYWGVVVEGHWHCRYQWGFIYS